MQLSAKSSNKYATKECGQFLSAYVFENPDKSCKKIRDQSCTLCRDIGLNLQLTLLLKSHLHSYTQTLKYFEFWRFLKVFGHIKHCRVETAQSYDPQQ